ncbi:MAG: hypothetical protein GY801_02375 [bacterium]|nr:hypothetical protein [bacterium]
MSITIGLLCDLEGRGTKFYDELRRSARVLRGARSRALAISLPTMKGFIGYLLFFEANP